MYFPINPRHNQLAVVKGISYRYRRGVWKNIGITETHHSPEKVYYVDGQAAIWECGQWEEYATPEFQDLVNKKQMSLTLTFGGGTLLLIGLISVLSYFF